MHPTLTQRSVEVMPVRIPLKRSVVSRLGFYDHWPVILTNLTTDGGIVGRRYIEPNLKNSFRSIIPTLQDLAAARKGKPLAPVPAYHSKGLWLTDVESLGREAAEPVEEGQFSALKRRLGRAYARQDHARN